LRISRRAFLPPGIYQFTRSCFAVSEFRPMSESGSLFPSIVKKTCFRETPRRSPSASVIQNVPARVGTSRPRLKIPVPVSFKTAKYDLLVMERQWGTWRVWEGRLVSQASPTASFCRSEKSGEGHQAFSQESRPLGESASKTWGTPHGPCNMDPLRCSSWAKKIEGAAGFSLSA